MCDERLITCTRKRIDKQDYEAVFAGGGCFHFALRLHERFGYKIRGIRAGHDGCRLSHVWCQKPGDCRGVDIRGFYPEDLLAKLATGGDRAAVCDVSLDEVRNTIAEKEYPPELENEIKELADKVFDTHRRFEAAKPSDNGLCDRIIRDLEEGN